MDYTQKEVLEASLEYFGGDDLAAKTFVDKYALREGDIYHELTPADMHDRLAGEFARIEQSYDHGCPPFFALSKERIRMALGGFDWIVPAGSPMYGIGNPYAVVSLSNCTVIDSPEDNLSSIYERGRDLANLFKRRCGAGIDISSLRPDGSPVTNSARTSSGAWSFAEFYSYVSRHTAQQGRRGALMITMNIDHPDIAKFVTMKIDKTKVTGANISVMITDKFMEAVKADDWWYLQFPQAIDDEPLSSLVGTKHEIWRVRARELWRLICQTATDTAEPGIIFIDTYKRNLPLDYYPQFKSITTNPCSEILMSPYESCRLMSLNLKGFISHPHRRLAEFDWDMFKTHINIAVRLLDDLVDLEIECLDKIIAKADTTDERALFEKIKHTAHKTRRIGLGTHGLADALAALGLRYDDPGLARDTIREIYTTLRNEAYRTSIQLAIERGPFPDFNWELEKACPFLCNLPKDIYDQMSIWGRRNGALLTCAPTGTVSIMSQTSSGIEPVFANSYTRRRKLSDKDSGRVDFTDATKDQFEEHEVVHQNIQDYQRISHAEPGAKLPTWFITASEIDWLERVKIQGVIQRFIDHGISSTINLPEGTNAEVVEHLYEEAHKNGLKGLTVYVAGSRDGVLLTSRQQGSERPTMLPCEIHRVGVTHKGVYQQFVVLVSFKDEKPFEVFGGEAQFLNIPKHYVRGQITKQISKNSKNKYKLEASNSEEDIIVQDLGNTFQNNDYSSVSRLISLALRNGTALVDVVDQLLKEHDADFFAYNRVIARVLKQYIEDGTKSSVRCSNCGSKALRFEEGCFVCTDCGFAGCN
jgi:ribonucleoside-diphosphate reductase alpha chain